MTPPSDSLNSKFIVMGEKWARAFAKGSLSGHQLRAVAEAYATLTSRHKTQVIHHRAEGHPVVIARMGRRIHLVEQGQLWGFDLERASTDPELSGDAIWEAYQAWRATPTPMQVDLRASGLMLTSFSGVARHLATQWGDDDLHGAFAAAGIPHHTLHGRIDYKAYPERMRMVKGYSLRTRFYLACIGRVLRPVREALPADLRRTLWSIQQPEGALAHWVLQGPSPTAQRYRAQALQVQPLLLPRLLWQSWRSLPIVQDDTVQLFKAEALLEVNAAIDGGRPFVNALVESLNHQEALVESPQDEFSHGAATQWTKDHGRYLAGRRRGAGLTLPQMLNRLEAQRVPSLVSFAQHLAPARQPRKLAHWQKILRLLQTLGECVPDPADLETLVVPRSDAFLRGCPTDWDDAFYQSLAHEMTLVNDAMRWLAPGNRRAPFNESDHFRQRLVGMLNLRQLLNMAAWVHTLARGARETRQATFEQNNQTHQRLLAEYAQHRKWEPAMLDGPWAHGAMQVIELVNDADAVEEGKRMQHCVGDGHYTDRATMGQCRLFSVRTTDKGASVSTFELIWNPSKKKIEVRQHFGPHDTMPSKAAQDTVRAFMRAKRVNTGPWPENSDASRLVRRMQCLFPHDTQTRQREDLALTRRLQAELLRRFPQVGPLPPVPELEN